MFSVISTVSNTFACTFASASSSVSSVDCFDSSASCCSSTCACSSFSCSVASFAVSSDADSSNSLDFTSVAVSEFSSSSSADFSSRAVSSSEVVSSGAVSSSVACSSCSSLVPSSVEGIASSSSDCEEFVVWKFTWMAFVPDTVSKANDMASVVDSTAAKEDSTVNAPDCPAMDSASSFKLISRFPSAFTENVPTSFCSELNRSPCWPAATETSSGT